MINITFYQFSKKPNSTKLPNVTGTTYQCEIIEDCSIMSPIVIIKGTTLAEYLGAFNYAYIPTFNRYYFVSDSTYNAHDGFWHFTLNVDVLASAKTDIMNTLQFVERSSISYDLDLIDTYYPSKATPQYFNRIYSNFFNATPSNGQYIIGVTCNGQNMSRFGGLQYYILDSTQMNDLIDYMLGMTNYTNATALGIATELAGLIGEPLQFIASCKFFPRTLIDTSGMTATPIKFGTYVSTVNGYKLPSTFLNPAPVIKDGFTMPLDNHPQSATRGSWLNGNTNTERILRFEPFGVIPLDSSRLLGANYIALEVATDIITGAGVLSIFASDVSWAEIVDINQLPLIGTYPSQVLIDIPLSQYRHEGILKSIMEGVVKPVSEMGVNVAQGFLSGGYIGAGVSGFESANNMYWSTLDGARNFWSPPHSQGVPSSLLCRMNVILTNKYSILVDEDLAQWGRPCCKLKSLNDLTGYVQCKGADISTTFTKSENDAIIGLMNSGFYIE